MKRLPLNEIEAALDANPSPKEFFGTQPENYLKLLQHSVHPDHNPGDYDRAHQLFDRINALYQRLNAPPVIIKSPKRSYEVMGLCAVGDVADLYHATCTNKNYILKISRIPDSHKMLERENKVLTQLLSKAGTTSYARYLPTIAESFPAKDKIQKHINVFVAESGFYNLIAVKKKHPALDGRHLGWIFNRLLTIIGFLQANEIVHGALLPEHIRLHPEDHGLQLVGWGHSVDTNQQLKTISAAYRSWYPKEVLDKQPVGVETDIYMAAKCVLWLGDKMPAQLSRFLRSCLLDSRKMRPHSAWDLQKELMETLKLVYGPPRFHPLVMEK